MILRIEMELNSDSEADFLGIKEAITALAEGWADIRQPVTVDVIDADTLKAEADELFDTFWAAYPKKENKKEARTAFRNVCRSQRMLKIILAGLEEYKRSGRWEDPHYIPLPTTWLRGRRWENPPTVLQEITRPARPQRTNLLAHKPSYDLAAFEDMELNDPEFLRKQRKKEA